MASFSPKTPISLQIRKIIFDNYNNVETPFTNDSVFEILQRNGDVDPAWIIDDIDPYVNELCKSGMARNIAQNLTTMWLKLFDTVERRHCTACNLDVFLGKAERQACPNPSCASQDSLA